MQNKKLHLFLASVAILAMIGIPVYWVLADPVGSQTGIAGINRNGANPVWTWLGTAPINGTGNLQTPVGLGSSITIGASGGLTSFGLNFVRAGDHLSWNHLHGADVANPMPASEVNVAAIGIRQVNGGAVYFAPSSDTGSLADGTGGIFQAIGPWIWNGTTYDRWRSVSAVNLTAASSVGIAGTVPVSTWSVTHTPAAATQATISKAAGGGTVRHVATTITACTAQTATGQTPIAINLRDGATGAGTILRTWKVASIIGDSKCVDLSSLAMIGTANTAMTIEFAAAGVAGSEQTVTLTGFSVP